MQVLLPSQSAGITAIQPAAIGLFVVWVIKSTGLSGSESCFRGVLASFHVHGRQHEAPATRKFTTFN